MKIHSHGIDAYTAAICVPAGTALALVTETAIQDRETEPNVIQAGAP
jgi:hypothetical protein